MAKRTKYNSTDFSLNIEDVEDSNMLYEEDINDNVEYRINEAVREMVKDRENEYVDKNIQETNAMLAKEVELIKDEEIQKTEEYAKQENQNETDTSIISDNAVTKEDINSILEYIEKQNEEIQDIKEIVKKQNTYNDNLLAGVRKMGDSHSSLAEQLNEINDKLFKENQQYKEDFYRTLILPVLREFVEFASDLRMDVIRYRKKGEEDNAILVENYINELNDVLERCNVEVYKAVSGEEYKPIYEKVVKLLDTDDIEKDKIIAECTAFGYKYVGQSAENEKIIMPCKVNVYKFKK